MGTGVIPFVRPVFACYCFAMNLSYEVMPRPGMLAPPTGAPFSATGAEGANAVPDSRQTFHGLQSVNGLDSTRAKFGRERTMIFSPNLSPSAVTTESALQSRSLMAPEFQHNMLATRIARISNLMAETPRFKRQIDILA